jgi:hypothetical protein
MSLTVQNSQALGLTDRPFCTCPRADAKECSQVAYLAACIWHRGLVVAGESLDGSSHHIWDLRARRGRWMVVMVNGDRLSDVVLLLSRCPRHSHFYGRHVCHHCCGGGFHDDLGRGGLRDHCCVPAHVVVRRLGPSMEPCGRDCGLCARLDHGHYRIPGLRYAFGRLRFGHGLYWYLTVASTAERRVEKEDGCQMSEQTSTAWAREPYGKGG